MQESWDVVLQKFSDLEVRLYFTYCVLTTCVYFVLHRFLMHDDVCFNWQVGGFLYDTLFELAPNLQVNTSKVEASSSLTILD